MGHNQNCSALRNSYRCSECTKGYMQQDSRDKHQKLCKERIKAMERNPDAYKE